MECRIHFLPALAGDCFVLEFDNKKCILIDAGYKSTYRDELKPLLFQLRKNGCEISLMVITHVDRDHIEGAIELIKDNGKAKEPKIIPIKNIWYNGFFNTLLKQECLAARLVDNVSKDMKYAIVTHIKSSIMNLSTEDSVVSARLAKTFEIECANRGYVLNCQFEDGIVVREFNSNKQKESYMKTIDDINITILNPGPIELEKWTKELDKYLKSNFGKDYKIEKSEEYSQMVENIQKLWIEPYEMDRNISQKGLSLKNWIGTSKLSQMNSVNRASIVMEIKYKNVKMLFMGDSESADWIKFSEKDFDIVKVSHHGTTKPNIGFLTKINPTSLMVSTNGSTNMRHPEKDFLARAIVEYKAPCIYFNYNLPDKQILEANQSKLGYKVFYEQRIINIGE